MKKKQIQVLIIDDEPVVLEESRRKIAVYVEEQGIYTASDSEKVMSILASTPIDLVFIDMQMPDTDGFAIASYIQSALPETRYVFLTGHAELGAKSYEYEPLDFLCKPLDVLRLQKTFERFEKSRGTSAPKKTQLALESTSGFVLISPEDISYITRENRKTMIHCQDSSYAVKNSLDELETMFSEFDFVRCHQSYLIPLHRVAAVEQAGFGRTYWADLDDGSRVPVSRKKYGDLRTALEKRGTRFLS